jgi:hypothetical protein
MEKEIAGIVQTPFHVGHNEMCPGYAVPALDMYLHWHGNGMWSAMQQKDTGYLDGGVSERRYIALVTPGPK